MADVAWGTKLGVIVGVIDDDGCDVDGDRDDCCGRDNGDGDDGCEDGNKTNGDDGERTDGNSDDKSNDDERVSAGFEWLLGA